MPTAEATDRAAARRFVKTVVLAQGNVFIRELLRDKQLPIGTNKDEFETNLLRAIDTGALTVRDLTDWLEKVEGWGDQHVYIYRLPDGLVADPLWASVDAVKARLPKADLKLWNASSLVFPDDWDLTGISDDGVSLCYIWHKRLTTLLRRPKQDRRERIDGDWYQFRAQLERPDRAVMRFVLRRDKGIAAVFMEIPAEGKAHEEALDRVRAATRPVVDWTQLAQFSTSDAIKNLDQAALNNDPAAKVKQKKTRLTDAADYVEFATDSDAGGFGQAVRSVRRAVDPANFAGNAGVFVYAASGRLPSDPPVRIEVSGPGRRIRLWAQLKAEEVWQILDLLVRFERPSAQTRAATP